MKALSTGCMKDGVLCLLMMLKKEDGSGAVIPGSYN